MLTLFKRLACGLAVCGLLTPRAGMADTPASIIPSAKRRTSAAQAAIVDVELDSNRALRGRVVSTSGVPAVGLDVTLDDPVGQSRCTRSNERGEFAFTNLPGGVRLLRLKDSALTVRLWTAGTSPPGAGHSVLLVKSEVVARGQLGFRDFFTQDAVVLGGIVLAAVIIPIAISDARNDSAPSS